MELEKREITSTLEVRSEGGKTHIVGLACPYYSGDPGTQYRLGKTTLERFAPGSWDSFLKDNPTVEARSNHDPEKTFAVTPDTLKLWTDSKGLWFDAVVDPDVSYVRDTISNINNKVMRGCSVCFAPLGSQWTKEGSDEIRTITSAYLEEVSPVFRPAYKNTNCTVALRERDNWLLSLASQEKEKRLTEIMKSCHR